MPLDIASGSVKLDYEDVTVTGQLALVWDRRYSTTLLERSASPLGLGWTSRYFTTLTQIGDQFIFFTPEGGIEHLVDPDGLVAKGGIIRHFGAFLELFFMDGHYIVQRWNVETGEVLRYCFCVGQPGTTYKLSSIEDVTGQAIDLLWNDNGLLSMIHQRLERHALLISYNKAELIANVILKAPNGNCREVMRYEYDDKGRQISAWDAAEFADRFEYDVQGRLIREVVKDGGVFHYFYHNNRCIKRTGLNRYDEKRLRYMEATRVTEVTNSYGHKFLYQYLPSGQITLETDPLGGRRTTEYDEHGRIVGRTDGNGASTLWSYDRNGNRNTITDALGNTTTFIYNDQHLPTSTTDPLGHVWRREYDQANRLISVIDPQGERWSIRYNPEGAALEVENPLGAVKRLERTLGIINAVTDWMGNITRFELDVFGRVARWEGPAGDFISYRYDKRGNVTEVCLSDGATMCAAYDSADNLTSVTDCNGYVTRFRYGPCRRLLERIDAAGRTTRYIWGTEPGRLERIINEKGEVYNFLHDEAGRIIREKSFDGSERAFCYDSSGYVIAYTNANGETIKITRDALHRIIHQSLPEGEVRYGFDYSGNLISAVNDDITVTFERDPFGRITRECQGEHSVESHYDSLGRLVRTSTSLGHVVNYDVDPNGFVFKLTTLNNDVLEFERNVYGQETRRRLPWASLEQSYDDRGRLIEQRVSPDYHHAGKIISSAISPASHTINRKFAYDPNSSVTFIRDSWGGCVKYLYDPAERLLQATREGGASELFSYDDVGNVIRIETEEETANGEILFYSAGNRLMRRGDTYYEYDSEGRRIKMIQEAASNNPKIWTYKWDVQDRLRAVTRPDGQIWAYKYDALGRRVAKSCGDICSSFIWDKDVVVHESNEKKSFSSWIFDAYSFVPIATVQNRRVYSVICDHLGTPQELIDGHGNVELSLSLASWGAEIAISDIKPRAVVCPIRFQGQWGDDETGLYYNRFRYYDPHVGLYVSQDPNRLNGGLNLYAYGVNPCNFIDPTGLCAASDLPQLKGKSEDEVRQILAGAGFRQTHVSNSPGRNERWSHPDGSEVRIHPYGNQAQAPWRSANNAHVHKESSSGQQLTDRGIPSTNPAETHIGIPNPPDLPAIRGRPHGAGTS